MLTLDVEKCYLGDVGSTVTVYEDGGYVRLSELKEDLAGHEAEAQTGGETTGSDPEETVADVTFMGAGHSRAGDEMIAYLVPNTPPMAEGSYHFLTSVFGRFMREGDVYVRPDFVIEDEGNGSGRNEFETTIAAEEMEGRMERCNYK